MALSPFVRCPITDLTGGLVSHQMLSRCKNEEIRYMDCLEAYGLDRGFKKCDLLFEDLNECQTLNKQYKRFVISLKRMQEGHVLAPFLRIPITDITAGLVSHQMLGRCGRLEMDYMECLEGYGLTRGLPKCNHLFEELKECQTLRKQYARFVAMRVEREKQIASGKLTGDKKYLSPRIDSY